LYLFDTKEFRRESYIFWLKFFIYKRYNAVILRSIISVQGQKCKFEGLKTFRSKWWTGFKK